jgi:signal transduction histidine kinase
LITAIPLALFASAALVLWLGALIYRRATAARATMFVWLLAASAVWCIGSALEGLSHSLVEKILWSQIQYIGISGVPPLWFLFLAQYVGSPSGSNRRLRIGMGAMAIATVVIAFTNGIHGLMWKSIALSPEDVAIYTHGPFFWIVIAYSYLLTLAGAVMLVRALRRSPALFRGQLVVLVMASVIPIAFNALYLLGFGPGPEGFDATPLSFACSAMLFTWALYRTYLFDLIPVARDMLVDSMSDAVIVVDPQCRVLDMNAAARSMTAIGSTWTGRQATQVLPILAGALPLETTAMEIHVAVTGAGNGRSQEHVPATSDPRTSGSPIPDPRSQYYDIRTMPVRAGSQGLAAWVVVLRDVTEQRRAQEEHAALEARVQEQQKQESLSVMAGGLAHDFNNLLAGIVGNADLLAMQIPPGSAMGSHIGAIMLGAQRAADLVGKMLAYAGERHGSTERLDLDAMVTELLELLRASAARHCMLQHHGQSAVIVADPTQIRQVAMNLIINAAEAVDENTGAVTVTTGVERLSTWALAEMTFGSDIEPGTYAFLDVRDNGPGMDAETSEKIFNPFFTTKPTGHGLGLAAVQGIVRGHHGALRVDSAPGTGSRFRVWFPSAPAGDATEARRHGD